MVVAVAAVAQGHAAQAGAHQAGRHPARRAGVDKAAAAVEQRAGLESCTGFEAQRAQHHLAFELRGGADAVLAPADVMQAGAQHMAAVGREDLQVVVGAQRVDLHLHIAHAGGQIGQRPQARTQRHGASGLAEDLVQGRREPRGPWCAQQAVAEQLRAGGRGVDLVDQRAQPLLQPGPIVVAEAAVGGRQRQLAALLKQFGDAAQAIVGLLDPADGLVQAPVDRASGAQRRGQPLGDRQAGRIVAGAVNAQAGGQPLERPQALLLRRQASQAGLRDRHHRGETGHPRMLGAAGPRPAVDQLQNPILNPGPDPGPPRAGFSAPRR